MFYVVVKIVKLTYVCSQKRKLTKLFQTSKYKQI